MDHPKSLEQNPSPGRLNMDESRNSAHNHCKSSLLRGGGELSFLGWAPGGDYGLSVLRGRRQGLYGRGAEARGPGFDFQRHLVELVVIQKQRRVEEVVSCFTDELDLVRSLLEMADFSDHVGNLWRLKWLINANSLTHSTPYAGTGNEGCDIYQRFDQTP